MNNKTVCITPECNKNAEWKGLCRSCYGQARSLIEEGKTTWEELGEMGMCLIDQKPFRKLFFEKKLQETKQEKP